MAWFWRSIVWLRYALILSTAITAGFIAYSAYQNPFVEALVNRSTEEVRQTINQALAREVDQAYIDNSLTQALEAEPIAWTSIRLTQGLADKFGISPSPAVASLLAEQTHIANLPSVKVVDCFKGVFGDRIGDTMTQATCGGLSELTSVGDVKSLLRAAEAYNSGQEIDRFDASLGAVGLVLTGATLLSAGTAAPAKGSVAAIKTAKRADALSPAMLRYLKTNLTKSIDVEQALKLIRAESKKGWLAGALGPRIQRVVNQSVDRKHLRVFSDELIDLGKTLDRAGLENSLYLVKQLDGAQDMARLRRLSKAMGPDTALSFRVFGKGSYRFLTKISKSGLKLTRALRFLYLQGWALAATLLLSTLQGLGSWMLKATRRTQ